jgi:hypothetical protein
MKIIFLGPGLCGYRRPADNLIGSLFPPDSNRGEGNSPDYEYALECGHLVTHRLDTGVVYGVGRPAEGGAAAGWATLLASGMNKEFYS